MFLTSLTWSGLVFSTRLPVSDNSETVLITQKSNKPKEGNLNACLNRLFNSLNPARVRIAAPQKLKQIFVHETRMKSSLSLQKFQEDDTQVWAINSQQRKELLFSRKIHSGAQNRLSPASVEWGGLRRIRAHRVKGT
ncbi:hypothetical protein AVEN_146034-1 [Araneus ventricosus]|uniref:Uncharacterized protein n=1 Tax=Araneus ventricosus TaxID=182803 RepID=A0A4Y2GY14_ARAVE|nr:hypothetical protein AVEN_146034-1 [Araneus ventricosus]